MILSNGVALSSDPLLTRAGSAAARIGVQVG
jgi:hypothetical protein